jgi:hypothetical protein
MPRDPAELRARARRLHDQQNPQLSADQLDPAQAARAEDYAVFESGGRPIGVRAPNQKIQLLLQFQQAGADGLTDEEAGRAAGLMHANYWHRCTDLRSEGWIEWHPAGAVRKGTARVRQRVSVITESGLAALTRREM